jgi:hypothetical protein
MRIATAGATTPHVQTELVEAPGTFLTAYEEKRATYKVVF